MPFGGTLKLPEGLWGELPDPPKDGSGEFPLYAASGPKIVTDGWLYDDQTQRWTKLPRPDGAPERTSTAVWAGEELVTLGGYTPDEKYTDAGLSRRAFAYRP